MGLFDLFKKKEETPGYKGILIPPPPKIVRDERKMEAVSRPQKVQEVDNEPAIAPGMDKQKAEVLTVPQKTQEEAKEPTPTPAPEPKAAKPSPQTLSLEELLRRAGSETEYRTEFYKRLLTDELIIITQDNGMPPGRQTLTENMQVNIASFPDGVLPVFTSTDRIFDKGIVKHEVHYLVMQGEQLFTMTKGATFALNPYSDFGKKLDVVEIETMLSGQIFSGEAQTQDIDEEVEVTIGPPPVYPSTIVTALKLLLASMGNVKAAYLAWIQHPDLNKPNYIFAVDAYGDTHMISSAIAAEVKKHLAPDDIFDIIKIEPDMGVSSYFLEQTTPFYIG